MSLDPISSMLDIGKSIIERIWPDPAKQAEEFFKLQKLAQEGDVVKLNAEVSLMLAQIEVNKIDAKSGNLFQAGWRPSIGWIGSISLGLMYIPKAIMLTYMWSWQNISIIQKAEDISKVTLTAFPNLGSADIIGLLGSLLGVGIMRSYDKKQGTDSKK